MAVEIKVPSVGESVSKGVLSAWLKQNGDVVREGEEIFELETEKATMAVPAPADGVLEIRVPAGAEVAVDQVVGRVAPAAGPQEARPQPGAEGAAGAAGGAGEEAALRQPGGPEEEGQAPAPLVGGAKREDLSPAVRRLLDEYGLDPHSIRGTGRNGRITREDVLQAARGKKGEAGGEGAAPRIEEPAPEAESGGWARGRQPIPTTAEAFVDEGGEQPAPAAAPAPGPEIAPARPAPAGEAPGAEAPEGGRRERRVPLTALRRRIAENLVRARQSAAHLTTFNEIDMQEVMNVRSEYREEFERAHGVRIGFMSFFVKACCLALKEFPEVNARLEGDDLVYHDYYDIGVAVSTERGLLVPVLRDADRMGFARIEQAIASLARRARERKITPDELIGGTFSITNGGVFGSLLSTPIPNHPQTAILGMHAVQKRPVAVGDQVAIRPMMYVALTYDHRVIDGREAVSFLVRVKQYVEDPRRLLLSL